MDPETTNGYAGAISTVVDAFGRLVTIVGQHLVSSFLTCGMLIFAYGGYESIQQGSFSEALHVLTTSQDERAKEAVADKAAKLQSDLRAVAASNAMVHQTLDGLLAANPGAVRVRAAMIHNGLVTITQRTVLRWDIMAAQGVRGRSPGPMDTNKPLIAWNSYLPDLLAGKCVYRKTESLDDAGALERMRDMGIVGFIVCPILNASGQMTGGLFLSYDADNEIPTDMTAATESVRAAAIRVGAAWEMRPVDLSLRD